MGQGDEDLSHDMGCGFVFEAEEDRVMVPAEGADDGECDQREDAHVLHILCRPGGIRFDHGEEDVRVLVPWERSAIVLSRRQPPRTALSPCLERGATFLL